MEIFYRIFLKLKAALFIQSSSTSRSNLDVHLSLVFTHQDNFCIFCFILYIPFVDYFTAGALFLVRNNV